MLGGQPPGRDLRQAPASSASCGAAGSLTQVALTTMTALRGGLAHGASMQSPCSQIVDEPSRRRPPLGAPPCLMHWIRSRTHPSFMTRLQIQFVHSSWHFLTACSIILPASVYFLWSVAMRVRSVRTGQYKCDVHFGQGAGVDRIVGRSAAPDARMFFVTRIGCIMGMCTCVKYLS